MKYMTARGVASWTISQRFMLDVSIRDPASRFGARRRVTRNPNSTYHRNFFESHQPSCFA